ncbi:MAG TPA: MgtC/SapB family protein [Candidatus Dormibacteraeota bacterium]|nr:MgtC/SapB family protein [Candidatus Dormibacteraeota bacterium]
MPRTSLQAPGALPAEAESTPLSGELDLAVRVAVALVIGLVFGAEREIRGHPAGLRTMALISAGSCVFTGLGLIPFSGHTVDPTRIAAQIVTGVGFLGAGSILRQGEEVRGLTTAASIWVIASLGMAVGFGYYVLAVIASVLVLATLIILKPIEDRVFPVRRNRRKDDPRPEGFPPQ